MLQLLSYRATSHPVTNISCSFSVYAIFYLQLWTIQWIKSGRNIFEITTRTLVSIKNITRKIVPEPPNQKTYYYRIRAPSKDETFKNKILSQFQIPKMFCLLLIKIAILDRPTMKINILIRDEVCSDVTSWSHVPCGWRGCRTCCCCCCCFFRNFDSRAWTTTDR